MSRIITSEEFRNLAIPVLEELRIGADAPYFERGPRFTRVWSLLPQNYFKNPDNHTSVLMAITKILNIVRNNEITPCQFGDVLEALGISVPS